MPPEHDDHLTSGSLRGRGAQLNPPNRFEPVRLSIDGDYMDSVHAEHPEGVQARTQVFQDFAKTILNRVDTPDVPMVWTVNPYRGCEHGCIYCYARPTHETFGLSCGVDFETKVFAKLEAPELLRRELNRRSWWGEPIAMSGITDPYQPVERELEVTRGCLRVMADARQPVGIITKNRMVTRDIDLLAHLAGYDAASVAISLTTLDPVLSQKMEPRASSPGARLRAMRELTDAGIPVAVMTAPIIPGLNDREIPALLEAAADAGATRAGMVVMRLPWQVKDLFVEWLHREFPDRAKAIVARIREVRGGHLTDPRFGTRMTGEGERAEQIRQIHTVFCRRYGLNVGERTPLSSAHFRRPELGGQARLFG
ncbi:MAG: radical SAM protein [Phycisphaeraceae bacterium]|nr:MAG: radical SAM protein [Phycisphaeraceae bacterium]